MTGANPGVVLDSAGTIYGVTPNGGVSGMIYKIGSTGETTLYSFPGASGGAFPNPVSLSSGGGYYGTAFYGGAANVGTVYELDASGHETVLHSFTGSDGAYPVGTPTRDSSGNFYGATKSGGASNLGVVFRVSASGDFTLLHSFTGGADGAIPEWGVVLDGQGNLYGTTFAGGDGGQTGLQEGVIFKMDPEGNETVLYSFTGLSDGGEPTAGLTRDPAGNLYGTTYYGGNGAGVLFELTSAGQYKVLHSFTAGADGGYPSSNVVFDPAGNLYGSAGYGALPGGLQGQGVIFEYSATGDFSVLYTFVGGRDGGGPGGVTRDKAGNLYGTTDSGGSGIGFSGFGVIFQVSPSGEETVIHTFKGGSDGVGGGTLTLDGPDALVGNSYGAGAERGGLLYRINLQTPSALPPLNP